MAGQFVMTKAQGDCSVCGSSPRNEKDRNGPKLPMIVAVGIDINWGEDLKICQPCANVIADLMGRADAETTEELGAKVVDLTTRVKDQGKKLKEQQKVIDRIKDGAKAAKELKAS